MKKFIKFVVASALILGFNAMAAGGGAFGTTGSSIPSSSTMMAAGGGAFGTTGGGG